jgi:hypothetical protein
MNYFSGSTEMNIAFTTDKNATHGTYICMVLKYGHFGK